MARHHAVIRRELPWTNIVGLPARGCRMALEEDSPLRCATPSRPPSGDLKQEPPLLMLFNREEGFK